MLGTPSTKYPGQWIPEGAWCSCCGKNALLVDYTQLPYKFRWHDRYNGNVIAGLPSYEPAVIPAGAPLTWGLGHPNSKLNSSSNPFTYRLIGEEVLKFKAPDWAFAGQEGKGQQATELKCAVCGRRGLDSKDLEINPVTGNPWGCPTCGGKKLVGVKE